MSTRRAQHITATMASKGEMGDEAKITKAKRLTLGAVERKLADGTLSPVEKLVVEVAMLKAQQSFTTATQKLGAAVTAASNQAVIVRLSEDANFGKPFRRGKRKGANGIFLTLVKRLLRAKPKLSNMEIWRSVSNHPPTGWTAFDNRTGKYLEGPKLKNISFKTLCNNAAIARTAMKAKI